MAKVSDLEGVKPGVYKGPATDTWTYFLMEDGTVLAWTPEDKAPRKTTPAQANAILAAMRPDSGTLTLAEKNPEEPSEKTPEESSEKPSGESLLSKAFDATKAGGAVVKKHVVDAPLRAIGSAANMATDVAASSPTAKVAKVAHEVMPGRHVRESVMERIFPASEEEKYPFTGPPNINDKNSSERVGLARRVFSNFYGNGSGSE